MKEPKDKAMGFMYHLLAWSIGYLAYVIYINRVAIYHNFIWDGKWVFSNADNIVSLIASVVFVVAIIFFVLGCSKFIDWKPIAFQSTLDDFPCNHR